MGRRCFIELSDLKKGMQIDQSIVDTTGRILVARGNKLEGYHIEELRSLPIKGVYISEDDTISIQEAELVISSNAERMVKKLSVDDRPAMKLQENIKSQIATCIQFMYNNPASEKFMETTNVVADSLLGAMMENDAVAIDINTLKVCDEYTFKHSVDVGAIAMVLAKGMGMNQQSIREVGICGLLHDVGKSKIPLEILNKPGRLTEEEFAVMKKHPLYSYEIIKEKHGLSKDILLGVLQHHEKMGGTGYPLGLTGPEISLFGKILAVADIYDALVTERPYKSAFSPRDAVEMILAMSGELDLEVIKVFMKSVILYPIGTILRLSNGEVVRVVENIEGYPTRPKVVELKSGKIYDLANDFSCASLIIP